MLGSGLLAGAGCAAPAAPSGPTEMVLHVADYDAFVDSTLSVLRRWDFPPDRVNRELGIIVTEPSTGAQWFEFWRIDAPGGYQTAESSLHTVRRIVTVNVAPVEGARASTQPAVSEIERLSDEFAHQAGNYRVSVRVDKQRFSGVERQVTTASGAMALFSARTPTTEGRRGPRSRQARWVPLGRDGLLEDALLEKIARAAEDVPPAPAEDAPSAEQDAASTRDDSESPLNASSIQP